MSIKILGPGVGVGGATLTGPVTLGAVAHHLAVAADGSPRLVGDATQWDDVLPTVSFQLNGVEAPNITPIGGSAVLRAQEFPNSSANEEFCPTWQLPHIWKEGSAFVPHLHLYVPDNAVGGDLVFSMIYAFSNVHATAFADAEAVTGKITRAAEAGIDANAILAFPAITIPTGTLSALFSAQIKRVQGGADTFGGTCWLRSADLHIEIDALGSRQEYVK
jgi:hypothetical protein